MMKKLSVMIVLAGVLLLGACHPRFFHTALLAAAVVGTIAVLSHHDAHFHDEYCGHQRVWQDDRWVYYYHDRWEYYDPSTGSWYYYQP